MRSVPILLFLLIICVLPLATGTEAILLVALPGGLPLGTLLAAIAFVSAAAVAVAASRPGSLLRRFGLIVLALAVLWLPLGIHLSGNAALRFVNDAADSVLFWRTTRALAGLILLTTLWSAVAALIARRENAGDAS